MTIGRYDNYSYLLEKFTEEQISNRYLHWYERATRMLQNGNAAGSAYINERLLDHMIFNYYADIARLKDFHEIDRTNKVKVFSYSAFWWLRTSPIQITADRPDSLIFLNEKFIATVIYDEFIVCYNYDEDKNCKKMEIAPEIAYNFLCFLTYYFKYRGFNTQNIELMITSLLVGGNKLEAFLEG